jgi:hypothetical protein
MAAPGDHTTVVALLENMIKRQTYGSGTVNNSYGYGRVDAWRSFLEAQAAVSIGPGRGEDPLPEVPPAAPKARIAQNTPNPFNPLTQIEFELSHPGGIHVTIHDALGRNVRTLIDGRFYAAGVHRVRWDGLDDDGVAAASGVYFCRLEGNAFSRTRKMALIR